MSDSWQDSVVLITSRDRNEGHFGTGFVIHRDKENKTTYLLTCAHVVRDVGGPEEIEIDGIQARVIASSPEIGADLAVLRIERLLDRPPLPLYTASEKGSRFGTAGFQLDGKQFLIRELHGTLGEQVWIHVRGQADRIGAWDLEITDKYSLQPGYSGSPVVDEYGNVIGVVNLRRGEGKMGLAISIEALEKVWLEMPPGLFVQIPPLMLENTAERQDSPLVPTAKKQVLLDRRLVTEVVALFTSFSKEGNIDPRTLCLLQFGLGMFDQLIVEQDYGSALANLVAIEKEILGPAVTFYQPQKKRRAKDSRIEEIEDSGDLWVEDPQFQLIVSRYDRSKGSSTGNMEANVLYLQWTLQLAKELNAAIIPHPDRWFLYQWWFEHCIWAAKSTLPRTVSTLDQKELIAASLPMPKSRYESLTKLSSRFPNVSREAAAIVRYGPIPYPFPSELLRYYDLEHLERLSPFLYEFCIPSSALSLSGGA